ncbi:MAG: serine hydrolase [Allosphingosinicella sp.]|uniref:serine hydrolase n=1 Tax=Allosphingosinicella sp. TaxID=2823234 RepID=UPI003944B232
MRRFAWLVWILALVAQPAWAQSSGRLQQLEQRLASLATENPGDYGFAALDLSTGEMVSFNGGEAFPMASTMKIAVAAVYLDEVEAGRRSLDDTIGGVSAYRLMDAMITRSDNRATDQLIAMLGGPAAIDQWLRAYGITGMRVDRTIAQLLADRRDLRDVRDSSTPVAMLNLLRLIDAGQALQPRSRAMLLDMMARCRTGSNRIRGLLPPGTHVENKTGTLNGYTGDVGFLTLPDGQRIAVVFFARYGDNRPAVIASAARAIYDNFAPGGAPAASRATMAVARH